MEYLQTMNGYQTKTVRRGIFTVVGYTIVLPFAEADRMIPRFWDTVIADGRLDALRAASSIPTWVLGLGSWDPTCGRGGQRHTICIEATEHTDFTHLAKAHELFPKDIGASDWLCFEVPGTDCNHGESVERFWDDSPYEMIEALGYRLHRLHAGSGYGLHVSFEAYPPGFDPDSAPEWEYWIPVTKGGAPLGEAERHVRSALAVKRLGRLAEAEETLRKALEIDPDHVDAHRVLAYVLVDLERNDEAAEEFRRVLELTEDEAVRNQVEKGLERLE